MASPACTILIAAADLLPELEQAAESHGEVLAFTDAEALQAFEAITARRPTIITLDHGFASTPRGSALIDRVRADPTLSHADIRVVSERGDASTPAISPAPAPAALDQRGTRRAPRYRIAGNLEVLVDGTPAVLVDLSTMGAQVLRAVVLKPNQRVRLSLSDPDATIRVGGIVAWASFEIPPDTPPRYRAGIEFHRPDHSAVDTFRARHQEGRGWENG